MSADFVGAILVGGRSSRMGGEPKGLLPVRDDRPIVEGLERAFSQAGLAVFRVGDVEAYGPRIADAARGLGPLAGWVAALRHAAGRTVIAVACDMPEVDARAISRLRDAAPEGHAAAAHDGERWIPTFARLPAATLPVAEAHLDGERRSLAAVLDAIGAIPVPFSPRELVDLDTPDDVLRYRQSR